VDVSEAPFAEINWSCYIDNSAVNVGPDYAYLDRGREGQDGVDDVDVDWDVGKPMATATVKIRPTAGKPRPEHQSRSKASG